MLLGRPYPAELAKPYPAELAKPYPAELAKLDKLWPPADHESRCTHLIGCAHNQLLIAYKAGSASLALRGHIGTGRLPTTVAQTGARAEERQ